MSMILAAVAPPRRRYTRVANDVLRDPGLSPIARLAHGIMSGWSAGRRFGLDTLAGMVGCCVATLRKALAELESRGLLTRRQRNTAAGFGDVELHLPDPTADTPLITVADLREHDVSAGGTVDKNPADVSMSLQDHVPEEHVLASTTPRKNHPPRKNAEEKTMRRNAPMTGQRDLLVQAAAAPSTAVVPTSRPLPAQTNAGEVVRAWIDYCTARDVLLPRRIVGHYAKVIGEAVADGFGRDLIVRALAGMLADGIADRPSLLPNRLVRAQTGGERRDGLVEWNGRRVRPRIAAALDRVIDDGAPLNVWGEGLSA